VNFPLIGADVSNCHEFHSNFSKIQSGLSIASSEITDIQLKLVKLTEINDFGYNIIKRPVLQNCSQAINDLGVVSTGIVNLDYTQGGYQKCLIADGYYTFNIENWPPNNTYSRIRLEAGNNATVSLVEGDTTSTTSTCYINFSGNVTYISTDTSVFSFDTKPLFWDIWTIDNGENIFVKPLSIGSGTNAITLGPLPTITSMAPDTGPDTGATSVTIIGTNFTGTFVSVLMNGTNNCTISSRTNTQITFITEPGSGVVPVIVRTSNGSSNSRVFSYYSTGWTYTWDAGTGY
jgi:hypothetical protein